MEDNIKLLQLDKYVTEPAQVCLTTKNILECRGVYAARNVIDFDAATDPTGAIHCIFYTKDGTITYFRTENNLPVCKTIAKNIPISSILHISITELGGILHMCIALKSEELQIYHYSSGGNAWQSTPTKHMSNEYEFITVCPCSNAGFAVLTQFGDQCVILPVYQGKWLEEYVLSPPNGFDDVIVSCGKNALEFLWHIAPKDIFHQTAIPLAQIFVTSHTERSKTTMSNGNILLAKHVTQLQELQKQIDEMRPLAEEAEKLRRLCASLAETVRTHEAQLTRLSMKIQEQTNRINALAKLK